VLAVDPAAGPHVTAPVPGLAAGESRTVAVTAPACAPGGVVSATVDARDEVDEADEGGNVITVICPP
jgi:subtilase family serine protease